MNGDTLIANLNMYRLKTQKKLKNYDKELSTEIVFKSRTRTFGQEISS